MHLEYESWRQLLSPAKATVRTPWGEDHISQTRGIRQGAVESPWLFSVAMELALREAQSMKEWPRVLGAAPDLKISELLFMDDSIIWGPSQSAYKVPSAQAMPRGLGTHGQPQEDSLLCQPTCHGKECPYTGRAPD